MRPIAVNFNRIAVKHFQNLFDSLYRVQACDEFVGPIFAFMRLRET